MKKRIEVTLGALKALARQMSVASGRKSIVWWIREQIREC
jgi:hypothetical protein